MLITQKQNDWTLTMEHDIRGEAVDIEPGYKEALESWKSLNESALPTLNAERRAELFTAYVREETMRQKKEIIQKKWILPAKKKELLALAEKDQLLLVSEDAGQHFNKVMTLEEVQQGDPLELRFLSSSMISTSLNAQDLVDEQALIQVASNLETSGYLIQNAFIQDRTIHVTVLPPMTPESEEVVVDMGVGTMDPYVPQFVSGGTLTHRPNTILAEQTGAPKEEPSLQVPSAESVSILSIENDGKREDAIRKQVAGALIAGATSTYLTSKSRRNHASEQEAMARANLSAENTRLQMQRPFGTKEGRSSVPNLVDIKDALAARAARQEHDEAHAQSIRGDREEKYMKEQRKAVERRNENEQKTKDRYQKAQEMRKNAAKYGAAAAATGFSATLGGLPLLLKLLES